MSKLYNFQVKTTISGFVQYELDDDTDLEKFAEEIEMSTVDYDEMNRDFPTEIEVETEVLDFGKADSKAGA